MAIVHIHIERTGGVSIQNLYEKKYPGPEMVWYSVRDGLFSPFNIKTANYTKNWQLEAYTFISINIPLLRKIMLRVRTIRRKRQAIQTSDLSRHAELVIGHFSVAQVIEFLPPNDNTYRTIVRDPLTRMWSHYCYWKAHKGDVGHRISPTFREDMTFAEFALLPEMANYQTQAVGKDLSFYEYIGTTNYLDDFAIHTGLISEDEQAPQINYSSEELPLLDDEFLQKFKDVHKEDYVLYLHACSQYDR